MNTKLLMIAAIVSLILISSTDATLCITQQRLDNHPELLKVARIQNDLVKHGKLPCAKLNIPGGDEREIEDLEENYFQ